jgi:hypothetical protein
MRAVILFFLLSAFAISQSPQTTTAADTRSTAKPPSESAPAIPGDLAQIVRQQFGPNFAIAMKRSSSTVNYLHPTIDPWTPFLTMDINNDGIEDAIIVARSKNPLTSQGKYNYKVVDPYFTYHGYGDPKVTATLTSEDPDQGHVVLVIHGAGLEAWRAAAPKAKFAIVNLPFENLSSSTTNDGKRSALNLESREITVNSVVFWDGKKYQWREQ